MDSREPPQRPTAALMPIESNLLELDPQHDKAAGGLACITSSLLHTLREAGIRRGGRTLLQVNQEGGFDCPSCAWPDPPVRATAEFCENGARAVADEATRSRITPEFFEQWSVPRMLEQSDLWLGQQGRLTHPMVRRMGADHYEPIGWSEAFGLIGRRLRELDHPNRAVFYTSGRTSNEAAFLYQLAARQLGTNNLPDCSNMCHESSGVALHEVIGSDKGTVLLEDFAKAQAIFVVGQNPGTNHPRMLSALRDAKLAGAKIVAINPLRELGLVRFQHPQKLRDLVTSGVELSDLHLQVRVGGDIALFKGIMKAMLQAEKARPGRVFAHGFIRANTSGYEALIEDLEATPWDVIVGHSGIRREEIEAAARIAIESEATIVCWAMGITQHKHGVANVQMLVDFLLLRGNIGRPGAGACPVRGHSNVQGDRTVGVHEKLPAWGPKMGEVFEFEPPTRTGYDTVGAIRAMHAGEVDVFFGLGGNFLSASPDTDYTAQAMRRCSLTVHVSTKLNRSHLVTGREALILPCLGRTEVDVQDGTPQFVTVENSMGIVHRSQGTLAPASEHLLSEIQIVARLARASLGESTTVDWEALASDYGRIRDRIAQVIPGFEQYNRRVAARGGFTLPNGPRHGEFPTPSGRALFKVHPLPPLELDPGQLWMTTVRSHDQFNTTIYGLDDRYRGIRGHRRVVMVSSEDMRARDLHEGQKVTLTSHFEGETRTARSFIVVPYDIPTGNVATYFPEANALVPIGSYAERSRTPTSKAVAVTIRPEPRG